MQRVITRKRASVAGLLALLVLAGGAYAFWTSSGSGTGRATTGSGSTVTVLALDDPAGLFPGGPTADLRAQVTNPGPGTQYVSRLEVSVTGVDEAPGAAGECNPADFTITQPPAIQKTFAVAETGTYTAKIKLENTAVNQDACKTAVVNLAYRVS